MGSLPPGAVAITRKRLPFIVIGILLCASTVLLLTLRSDLGFFLDDWALVIYRDSPGDWLLPHNEHIIVLPAAIYKLSLSLFGMDAMPIHVAGVFLFAVSILMLYFWLRPLAGEVIRVAGCAVMLFLGAAAADLLWTFQIGFFGSAAAGMGALLTLRVGRRTTDLLGCSLLVVSILFSSLALPFLAGAAVQLACRGESERRTVRSRLVSDSWIVLVPILIFFGWWLGWGHEAASSLSAGNVVRLPLYLLSAIGYSAGALTGLFTLKELTLSYLWAVPGLAVVIGLAALLRSRDKVPPEFLVATTCGLTFWLLAGLGFEPGREFWASRYQYPGALFLLMTLGGALTGIHLSRRINWFAGLVAAFSIAINSATLINESDVYGSYEQRGSAGLSAIDLARKTVDPQFPVVIGDSFAARVEAGPYLNAVERYGSPGLDETGIDALPVEDRLIVDQTLVGALPVTLLPGSLLTANRRKCTRLTASEPVSRTIPARSEYLLISASQTVTIRLGRFAPGASAAGWQVGADRTVGYRIPPDLSERAWRIGFEGEGQVRVCRARLRAP